MMEQVDKRQLENVLEFLACYKSLAIKTEQLLVMAAEDNKKLRQENATLREQSAQTLEKIAKKIEVELAVAGDEPGF